MNKLKMEYVIIIEDIEVMSLVVVETSSLMF